MSRGEGVEVVGVKREQRVLEGEGKNYKIMVKGSRKIWLMKGDLEGHSGEVGYTQYLSLDKVVTNDRKMEFSSSLTFVICYLQNLILINDSQTCLSVSTYFPDHIHDICKDYLVTFCVISSSVT